MRFSISTLGRHARKVALALALAAAASGVAVAPALADEGGWRHAEHHDRGDWDHGDWDHGDRDRGDRDRGDWHHRDWAWRAHERHEWRGWHDGYYAYAPAYGYAPPAVYGAPSLNFVVPLDIR